MRYASRLKTPIEFGARAVSVRGPSVKFMIRAYASRLTLAEAALMMRQAVKDKSHRATPVSVLVGRYVRWFRNEWGATAATIRDYEAILATRPARLGD